MNNLLYNYEPVNPTSWVYLSSLLIIALYFKFSRVWSMRNLDLIGLIVLSPGLLMVHIGQFVKPEGMDAAAVAQGGYIWLFTVGGLFVIRLLVDSIMVRRPLLDPNLSPGGLTFLGLTLFVFLMGTVFVVPADWVQEKPASAAPAVENPLAVPADNSGFMAAGPGNPLFHHLRHPFWERPLVKHPGTENKSQNDQLVPRIVAVSAHLLVLVGLVLIGYWHFDNFRTGIATAVLYLILPYTAQWTGQATHVIPAALLVWAIVLYRKPLLAGGVIGISIGTFYYAIFLLPLWFSFYFRRGWRRFLAGLLCGLGLMVGLLAWNAAGPEEFWNGLRQTLGWYLPPFRNTETLTFFEGFWGAPHIDPVYRIPVLAAFVVVACSLALWPSQKNLGTLLSCSAVVMLGTQFWNPHQGGLQMAWYLPLVLLTIFRPNLEDRVALSVLGEGWLARKKTPPAPTEKAA